MYRTVHKSLTKDLGLTEDDIMFMPAPLNHATGYHHGIISPMLRGGKVVLQERFCCVEAIELMNREKVTYSMGATRGSLNNNCIVVNWGQVKPQWLLLETFRGSQFVYVEHAYKEVFALAGLDAYAYCDKDPCKECSFRCKRGFALYAYLPGIGVVVRPIDQILTDKG